MTIALPRYSRIRGTGSYLPPERVSNADLASRLAKDGIETSDEWIVERTGIRFRHFAAPDVDQQRPRPDRVATRPRGRRLRSGRDRPDHRRDVDARHGVPLGRVDPAGQARRRRLRRIRRPGRLLGIRLCADRRRFDDQDRRRVEGAHRRRRGVFAHPRLQGPHHLRPVRRRRRRRRPGSERDARHPRQRAARRRPLRRHPLRPGPCLGRQRPRRSAPEDGRTGGLQARRRRAGEASPARSSRKPVGPMPTSTG